MSAERTVVLRCDAPDCGRAYGPVLYPLYPVVELRRLAAGRGWRTGVRGTGAAWRVLRDYCAVHALSGGRS